MQPNRLNLNNMNANLASLNASANANMNRLNMNLANVNMNMNMSGSGDFGNQNVLAPLRLSNSDSMESYAARRSLDDFTSLLASNSPTSLNDALIDQINGFNGGGLPRMQDYNLDPSSHDESTPEGVYSEYSSSSPEQVVPETSTGMEYGYDVPMQPLMGASPSTMMNAFGTLPDARFSLSNSGSMGSMTFNSSVKVKSERTGIKRMRTEEEECLSFQPYNHPNHPISHIFNAENTDITDKIDFEVKAEKNIKYAEADDAWVLYKQNQFQITVDSTVLGMPGNFYVMHRGTLMLINRFIVKAHAIQQNKRELTIEDETLVQIYQTGKARNIASSHIVEPAILKSGAAVLPKLRFQSSTANNARTKNNEPNPNQQFFRIIVSLFAVTQNGEDPTGITLEVAAKISNRLIVRGQNPGRYQNVRNKQATPPALVPAQVTPQEIRNSREGWVKRSTDTVYHTGKVGINTPNPPEAMTVHGNIYMTGNLTKPSDMRLKENFEEVDTAEQLEHIENLRMFDYDLKDWTDIGNRRERGVIAQDLEKVIPFAVKKLGDHTMNDGQVVQNLLVVNERVLLFENIGATQELGKILRQELSRVDDHDDRIDNVEEGQDVLLRDEIENRSRMDKIIDYITSDENEVDTQNSCCYCSFFGLGPAWTLWIMGWIFPPLWFMGIIFIASWTSSQRRWAGVANLITGLLCAFIVYTIYLLFVHHKSSGWIGIVAMAGSYVFLGITLIVALTLYHNKKNRRRRRARRKLRQDLRKPRVIAMNPKFYSYSSNTGSSKKLADMLPPRTVPNSALADKAKNHRKKKVSFNADLESTQLVPTRMSLNADDSDMISQESIVKIAAAVNAGAPSDVSSESEVDHE